MVKLKDYIKDVLASIQRGEVNFQVSINSDMEVVDFSPNKLVFTIIKR